jgi:hypothetical protein
MDELLVAEKLHREAAASYERASAKYEVAAMSGDESARQAAERVLLVSGDAYARTAAEMISARKRCAPTFEQLLRDPRTQMDPGSEILASILDYAAAKPASAGLPVPQVGGLYAPILAAGASVRFRQFATAVGATAIPATC